MIRGAVAQVGAWLGFAQMFWAADFLVVLWGGIFNANKKGHSKNYLTAGGKINATANARDRSYRRTGVLPKPRATLWSNHIYRRRYPLPHGPLIPQTAARSDRRG